MRSLSNVSFKNLDLQAITDFEISDFQLLSLVTDAFSLAERMLASAILHELPRRNKNREYPPFKSKPIILEKKLLEKSEYLKLLESGVLVRAGFRRTEIKKLRINSPLEFSAIINPTVLGIVFTLLATDYRVVARNVNFSNNRVQDALRKGSKLTLSQIEEVLSDVEFLLTEYSSQVERLRKKIRFVRESIPDVKREPY